MSRRTARSFLNEPESFTSDQACNDELAVPRNDRRKRNVRSRTEHCCSHADAERELTEVPSRHRSLKLNGINTVYGVPGIPIPDLGRMARPQEFVISFRHEQNPAKRGDRRLSDQTRRLPHGVGSRLSQWFDRARQSTTTVPDDPDIRAPGARDRRLQRATTRRWTSCDPKPLCKGGVRVLMLRTGIGLARAIRAAVSAVGRVYLDLPAKLSPR